MDPDLFHIQFDGQTFQVLNADGTVNIEATYEAHMAYVAEHYPEQVINYEP